ncbi:MAG: hypothetical protein SFU56_07680 [Capsulimonadales bacterium]|nr:hypothetical protein [Capsulimonadales bacterium]
MPHRPRSGRSVASLARCLSFVAGIALTMVAGASAPANAQVDVIATYAVFNNVYTYDFRVINNTPTEIALISARLPDTTFAVNNPTAPGGFLLNYSVADGDDNGVPDGYLDFLTDLDAGTAFGPFSTVGTFAFTSDTLLENMQFEGFFNDGTFTAFSGSVSLSAAPEPASALFLASCLTLAGYVRRRRA